MTIDEKGIINNLTIPELEQIKKVSYQQGRTDLLTEFKEQGAYDVIRADERAKVIRLLNDGGCLFDTDEWGEPLGRNDEFFLKELEYLETLTDDFDKYVDSQLV